MDIVERLRDENYGPSRIQEREAVEWLLRLEAADALEVCQAERDQARRSAKFWNENSADLSAQIAERTDALIAAKARAEKTEAEIERLRGRGVFGDDGVPRLLIPSIRNDALEEAAQVVERNHEGRYGYHAVAVAIRALKDTET